MTPDLTICMECGDKAIMVGGKAIYPHRPDLYGKTFWRCQCGAYVGCHPGTTNPLGYPAGATTRRARSEAHAAFDPLWKGRKGARGDAYAWLSEAMGLPRGETHISWMNAAQARRVVAVCKARQSSHPSPSDGSQVEPSTAGYVPTNNSSGDA